MECEIIRMPPPKPNPTSNICHALYPNSAARDGAAPRTSTRVADKAKASRKTTAEKKTFSTSTAAKKAPVSKKAAAKKVTEKKIAAKKTPALRYHEYEKAGHGEIMLALMSSEGMEGLPAIAADFVRECGEA